MIIDNEAYYDDVCQELENGRNVTLTVSGVSMEPVFMDGADSVLLTPLRKSEEIILEDDSLKTSTVRLEKHSDRGRPTNHTHGEGRLTLRRRDIVLFRHERSGQIKLHRIVHVWGTLLLIRGDGSYGPYERATVSDVIGVVLSGTCFGGHPFRAYSHGWSAVSRFWTGTYRIRLWTLLLCRFVKKRFSSKNVGSDVVPAR